MGEMADTRSKTSEHKLIYNPAHTHKKSKPPSKTIILDQFKLGLVYICRNFDAYKALCNPTAGYGAVSHVFVSLFQFTDKPMQTAKRFPPSKRTELASLSPHHSSTTFFTGKGQANRQIYTSRLKVQKVSDGLIDK